MSRTFGGRRIVVAAGAEDSDGDAEDCHIKFGSDDEEDDAISLAMIKRSGTTQETKDELDQADTTEEQLFFPRKPHRIFGSLCNPNHGWSAEIPPLPPGLEEYRGFGRGSQTNHFSSSASSDSMVPLTLEQELIALFKAVNIPEALSEQLAAVIGSIEALVEMHPQKLQEIVPPENADIVGKLEKVAQVARENEWISHTTIQQLKLKYLPKKAPETRPEESPVVDQDQLTEPASSEPNLFRVLDPSQTFTFLKSAVSYLGWLVTENTQSTETLSRMHLEETTINLRNIVAKTKCLKQCIFELQKLVKTKANENLQQEPVLE